VIGDPTGAFVSIFKSGDPGGEEDASANQVPGNFCWNELLTDDNEKAYSFYRELVGWGRDDMDMGPMGTYLIVKRGEEGVAGMMNKPPDATAPSFWLPYVAVDDVDATAARIVELGGQTCVAPQDIPGIGRFSVANDPLGATFAIYRSLQS
jgi:hypothetical protein